MKTYMANEATITRKWYVVDAEGKTLGRLATKVATILRGKHKPSYTPHVDTGDYVIVINAEKINLTGNKWNDKIYYKHSGYNGGLTETTAKEQLAKLPTSLVEKAVKGMIPHTTLGADMLRKLFVYAGPEHKHQAQQPESLEV
ncbi:50S ribosomal protein L13 [Acholeplasma oculi]|uniref:Large ribosomal subunit protein uL13 n=1 Tax=Acholeplasma oculi TaxID=35623 RepID=A0A061AID9_9MOLU|nr:50S ribosomal protein L13 [Acholeplasma oculi]CDR31391.1 50S ribosomal protein L13 [Acholeplasma oculi]SKC39630.1 LSU ribosomal protein L13P [Acholeplasma oculi]SUT91871.1 50S ribosomal protein L13 [Acholeplasma oculi]